MCFNVEDVSVEELPDMIAAERYAFETPLQPIFRLYCPIIDNDREKAIADTAAKEQARARNPDVNEKDMWIKAVSSQESETDEKLVGGAQWIFISNGSSDLKDHIESLAKRHPEGGARLFAEQSFRILCECEERNRLGITGTGPYATLGSFFTLPEYRKLGIGHLLMQWGLEKADEKGLDVWIEAAPPAVPFYERHGFIQKEVTHLQPRQPDGLSEKVAAEWDATAKSLLPITAVTMCRLAGSH
ncbi:GNAT family acetyltransferase [Penicillium cataractarum]|uniref:GNAT family acetyltransferase n=1 Tax=Penicillium cataractarum TaxID=2100454 RepID=A0A9X0B717_9EURO|nr:GNAT family acetyltransferase [Penicillium cataractarum]KAJ5390529.1 GNAT family acetyltransferase [Penicillium cataractarum]